MEPLTIISGGQTGVDRAALDVAMSVGLPVGGWCPAGRLAEDGRIPDRYPLRETPSDDAAQRTEWNVRDSDGTLVLPLRTSFGTNLALQCARRMGRPVYLWDSAATLDGFRDWLARFEVRTLNVAGPRESESPGATERTRFFLLDLLTPIVKP